MDRDTLSTDEDDDKESFIDHNERKNRSDECQPPSPVDHYHSRAFELESTSFHRRLLPLFMKKNRYYLLLIGVSLPLFAVLLLFSTDIKSFFSSLALPSATHTNAVSSTDPLLSRMRESELRALSLLREQQLSLISLFGKNNSAGNSSGSNAEIAPDRLKSVILNQISVNKIIEQTLLSSHSSISRSSNYTSLTEFLTPDFKACNRVSLPSQREKIEWKPRAGKFLIAICVSGQTSNHLICLQKHMFFAAVMGRVLVIPSPHMDYSYSRFLDVDHINDCLGRGKEKFAITFDEFNQLTKGRPHIDRFYCYFAKPVPCYVDEDHVKRLKGIGVSVPSKMETPLDGEDVSKPKNRTVDGVKETFGSVSEDVVAIGDVFFANVEDEWLMQPGGPVKHKCRTLIEPSRLVMLTAQRFVQTFLGKDFVALHFRRHGWLKFCNAKSPSCFYSVPQAADCIARVVAKTSAPVIYLSTDAAESETGLLQKLVIVNGIAVPLVKRPPPNKSEKWDSLLYRHNIEGDSQVEAMLDKTICAMSTVFIGSSGSTFTEDILRLRRDWGTASSCDEFLCQGELPHFVADNDIRILNPPPRLFHTFFSPHRLALPFS